MNQLKKTCIKIFGRIEWERDLVVIVDPLKKLNLWLTAPRGATPVN
jgi:hypothetical protein